MNSAAQRYPRGRCMAARGGAAPARPAAVWGARRPGRIRAGALRFHSRQATPTQSSTGRAVPGARSGSGVACLGAWT